MTLVRRFLVLVAVMFWQGGFTFYAGVVVHVRNQGTRLSRGQRLGTQPVTNYLNLAGLVALVFWAWDIRSADGLSTHGPLASMVAMAFARANAGTTGLACTYRWTNSSTSIHPVFSIPLTFEGSMLGI